MIVTQSSIRQFTQGCRGALPLSASVCSIYTANQGTDRFPTLTERGYNEQGAP